MKLPRIVHPSVVDIGDTIAVTLPVDGGIITTREGTVAKRMDNGGTRHMLTAEGATLLAWNEKDKQPRTRVVLLKRAPVVEFPLF